MTKILILAENKYEDQELWYPYQRLREAGFEPVIAGKEKQVYESKHGYPAQATATFKDCKADDFAGVIVPGGYAPDKLRMYPEVLKLVQEFDKRGKLIGAICHAAWVPVSAGIVKNRKMTCYVAIMDDVINAGANYVDEEVIVDKNLITSRTPNDLPAFMREILKFLK